MNWFGIVTVLVPLATAVSSCADLDGKDVFQRIPWYSGNCIWRINALNWQRFRVATNTFQVGAGALSHATNMTHTHTYSITHFDMCCIATVVCKHDIGYEGCTHFLESFSGIVVRD